MKARPSEIISVLLADDHPATRAGIRVLLEKAADIKIIGEAQDGLEAQQLVASLQPRILLLDLVMPGPSPSALETWVRENHPDTITLILTSHDRDVYLAKMMDTGAAGYLDKNVQAEQLIGAIRRAAHGESLFDENQLSRARRWHEEVEEKWNRLTEQERRILHLAAEGKANKHIAIILSITTKTVEKHLTNIYEKLGVASKAEAIVWWDKKGRDFPT